MIGHFPASFFGIVLWAVSQQIVKIRLCKLLVRQGCNVKKTISLFVCGYFASCSALAGMSQNKLLNSDLFKVAVGKTATENQMDTLGLDYTHIFSQFNTDNRRSIMDRWYAGLWASFVHSKETKMIDGYQYKVATSAGYAGPTFVYDYGKNVYITSKFGIATLDADLEVDSNKIDIDPTNLGWAAGVGMHYAVNDRFNLGWDYLYTQVPLTVDGQVKHHVDQSSLSFTFGWQF